MGQEAKEQINFVCLRAIIDGAIKKDPSAIEAMEGEEQEKHLKYMQKYAEPLLSKNEFDNGNFGVGLAVIAVGASYVLTATADVPNKLWLVIGGLSLVILSWMIVFWKKLPWRRKHELIQEIILKIEEKLLNRN